MAVTNEQKIDFLLKKIGFTKTKTGSVVGTGAISGTPKQPFAEAIPSPLIIANSALWNESGSIPTTPPGSDTAQVKVYLAATSGLRMTADATSSNQRAFIAYSTYGNSSSTRLTNWIDTQFGSAYLIKVYKGDPNSGGVALSAAGSGQNDGWFFDYSAGVLNFNDTNVPSGVTDTNIYIVGYRYIGLTGAPTPTGGGNFTYNDLVVTGNLQVAGISTFNGLVDINAGGQANTFKVEDLTDNRIVIAGTGGELEDSANLTFDGSTLGVTGDATFSGNVSIGGTLTYEDVKNVDAVGLITARSGIRVTGGVIEAQAGENKIPSLYANYSDLPNPSTYHGMFAHVHGTQKGYFAHAGGWYELVNKETNGTVGTGTERYNLGALVSTSTTATSLNVTGVTTAVTVDINGDLDVDGHTNLDNVSVAGVTTFAGIIEGVAGENKIPSLYANLGALPSAGTYHGMFAHVHATGRGYFAHAGNWLELVNKETNGTVGTGTETFNIGSLTATAIDLNGDIDVDGHTNLDNVSIAGVTTTAGLLDINNGGQANTFKVEDLTSGRVVLAGTGGELEDSANLTFDGNNLFVRGINIIGGGATSVLGADITTRNFKATGVSTFVGAVQFDSTIKAGGSNGTNGQYLKSTGSGVAWDSFPSLRTRQTFTASSGQTTFSMSYTINFLDVYVNGIKLTDSEFTATNGSSVVLAVGCFVGDIVELVAYNTVSAGGGAYGIGNLVEDLTPQLGGNLDLFNKSITGTGNINITGIITATKFVGDGSGLTGLVASGSGVIVKDSGSTVGTAGTINFGDNLSVSPISAGIVTITGSAGVTTSQFNVNKLHVSGITTFAGITSFTKRVDFDGVGSETWFWAHPNLPNSHMVWRSNVAGGNGGLYLQNSNIYLGTTAAPSRSHIDQSSSNGLKIEQYTSTGDNPLRIRSDFTDIAGSPTGGHSSRDIAEFNYHDGTSLYHFGNKKLQTSGVGVTVTGSLDVSEIRDNALSLKNAGGGATYATFSNGGSATLNWNNTARLQTTNAGITVTGTATATAFVGDGSGLTNVSAAGISTTHLRADTLIVGENNSVAVSTFHNRVHIPTNDTIYFGDGLDASISYPTSGYLSIYGGTSGNLDINTGGNADVRIRAAGDFRVDTDHNEIAIRALHDGAVELYQNGYGSPTGLRLKTTGVGVSVLGITSMTDNLMVGTGVTATTDGNAFFAGIVTATSFIGDGGGLTNVIGSGSGVVIKEGGSTVGTAGTINFVGVDVTDVSAGVVTVSTATTSITDGNSKLFVNNVSSSNGNGSFEVFLNEFTYGGTREVLNMHQPTDGYARIDLHHGTTPTTVEINAKTVYSGYARHRLKFETTNSSYGGQLDFMGSSGSWNFYSTYQGQSKNVISFNYNTIGVGDDLYPTTDNAFDLGFSNYKFRQFHVTGVNAGVVTATSFVGDGSQLTNLPGGGGGGNIGITTNISGSFTASAGTPATINTFTGYSSDDLVVEYTIYIKNGSDFQTQKLLAMRDGTTIHSTQFAVMFSSSLLVQCDATISSGNILLRATPETGVSGSTTYKIKREVM